MSYREDYIIGELGKMGMVGWYSPILDGGDKLYNRIGKSRDFANLAINPLLNVDIDSNDVVDGYTFGVNGAGLTTSKSVNAAQIINATGTSSSGTAEIIASSRIPAKAGEIISLGVEGKVSGVCEFYPFANCFNNLGTAISTLLPTPKSSSTEFVMLSTLNRTLPANTASIAVGCGIKIATIGDSGIVYLRNLKMVKATTLSCVGSTHAITSNVINHPCGKYMNGTTSSIIIPHDGIFDFTNSFTIGGFANSYSAKSSYLICKNNTDLATTQYGIYYNTGTNKFGVIVNGSELFKSNMNYIYNKYYFVIVTWDGATVKLYVNGVLDNSIAYTTPLYTGATVINIGKRVGGETHNGVLGDMVFGNKGISVAQVNQLQEMMFGHQYPGFAA